ncbi:MAG TPA: BatA domain-containing protein, partial [Chthoniobacterales bacterium]|nr:BatA domain-containing protein [Chthoniobacterales bacterium]
MLQLLSPIALFTLAALAIPAVLHLWRPPPRTIRVGTLRFFTGPAVQRLTKFRWRERLLLVVRLLLLAMLALLLAQPIWRKPPPTTPQRWALIEPGVVLEGEALNRLNELADCGFEVRELAPGFRRTSRRARGPRAGDVPDVWSLLREVDARLPAGSRVAVVASDRLSLLRGERPVMQHCDLDWISVPSARSAEATWIGSAQMIDDAKVRVAIRRSEPNAADEMVVSVPALPGRTALERPLEGWFVEVRKDEDGKLSARLVRDSASSRDEPWMTVVHPQSLRVAIIHSADRAEDARYLRAAVRAVVEVSGRAISISDDAQRADWIFWLNDEPPPAEIVEQVRSRGATLLSDAENSRERSHPSVSTILGDALHEPVGLFRRVPAVEPAVALWTDAHGTPLLSLTSEGNGRHLRFFSRFDPDWNDLPQSSALAVALRPLLLQPADEGLRDRQYDTRRADASQARPADKTEQNAAPDVRLAAPAEVIDLHKTISLLCAVLFAVE